VTHVGEEQTLGATGFFRRIARSSEFRGPGGDQFFQMVAVSFKLILVKFGLGDIAKAADDAQRIAASVAFDDAPAILDPDIVALAMAQAVL
jgi:hypothetical protein